MSDILKPPPPRLKRRVSPPAPESTPAEPAPKRAISYSVFTAIPKSVSIGTQFPSPSTQHSPQHQDPLDPASTPVSQQPEEVLPSSIQFLIRDEIRTQFGLAREEFLSTPLEGEKSAEESHHEEDLPEEDLEASPAEEDPPEEDLETSPVEESPPEEELPKEAVVVPPQTREDHSHSSPTPALSPDTASQKIDAHHKNPQKTSAHSKNPDVLGEDDIGQGGGAAGGGS